MFVKYLVVVVLWIGLFSCAVTPSKETAEQEQTPKPQRFILNDGLQVSLVPPIGFNLTAEHYGFVQPISFSRIKVYEVEVPYAQYLSQLSKENLALNKLQLIDQSNIILGDAICQLFALKQVVAGTIFDKQRLICGDELSSVVVEASYPESATTKLIDALLTSLKSLQVKAEKQFRLFTGLPFKLNALPNYKMTRRFSNSVVMVPIGDTSGKSSVVISHGISKDASAEALSELLINKGVAPENIEILKKEAGKLDGIPALVMTAYVSEESDTFWIKQWLSYQKDRFLLVQSRTPKSEKMITEQKLEELLAQFVFK